MVVVTSSDSISSNLRFGHAAAPYNANHNAEFANHDAKITEWLHAAGFTDPPPCRSRFRNKAVNKAVKISNAFRQALGWPMIEADHKDAPAHDGMVHIMPFIRPPPTFAEVENTNGEGHTRGGDRVQIMPISPHHRHHYGGHHGHFRAYPEDQSFMKRLHYALMALGPWEGRALAFVLGTYLSIFRLGHPP